MENIMQILDINTVLITIWGYPLSYIEFIGTVFSIWCVWLTAKAKIASWPVGLVGIVFYIFLFYQISLYSDLIEQIYFLVVSLIGWWMWLRPKKNQTAQNSELKITKNTLMVNALYLAVIVFGTLAMMQVAINLSVWFPKYFVAPASFPLLDAFTTVMSFVAQWLLAKKRIESWILWIVVDVIGIWLYWVKDVKLISLEYVVFLVIAISGLLKWYKEYKTYEKDQLKELILQKNEQ